MKSCKGRATGPFLFGALRVCGTGAQGVFDRSVYAFCKTYKNGFCMDFCGAVLVGKQAVWTGFVWAASVWAETVCGANGEVDAADMSDTHIQNQNYTRNKVLVCPVKILFPHQRRFPVGTRRCLKSQHVHPFAFLRPKPPLTEHGHYDPRGG